MPDNWADKRHSFSLRGIGLRSVRFTVRLIIACLGLSIFTVFLPPGKPWLSFGIILVFSVLLVIANNILDLIQAQISGRKKNNDDMIFTLISGAIEQVRDDQSTSRSNIQRQLTNIENVTKLIMGGEIGEVEISANFMTKMHNPDRLALTHWGTRLSGREIIELPIDKHNMLPGAPRACITVNPVHVHDTQAPEFQSFFVRKAYRSIVSIPVIVALPKRTIWGIVNVDSNKPDYFQSDAFVSETLVPKLMPFVHLISLELTYSKVAARVEALKD